MCGAAASCDFHSLELSPVCDLQYRGEEAWMVFYLQVLQLVLTQEGLSESVLRLCDDVETTS